MINVFWFRRDLRLSDNAGLYYALKSNLPILPVFIFDTNILGRLSDKKDARVEFIHEALSKINGMLAEKGSSLLVLHGSPLAVWKKLTSQYNIREVFTNNDYEPYAIQRDSEIKKFLETKDIKFNSFKDQVIFEKNEVVKPNKKPYSVFTPYSRTWLAKLRTNPVKFFPSEKCVSGFYKAKPFTMPSLQDIGFIKSGLSFPPAPINKRVIKEYDRFRDLPGTNGTSKLGIHLRFGTVSIRKVVKETAELNSTWLKELIWREFFMMILYYFPHSAENSFKREYDLIKWRNNEDEFEAWCTGRTGYPIVDAGMRELNETGYMHNRARMITAGFLTKHLLIDWRWGEQYFASKLLDYEMSSNIGNWQWAAGTGCDAAPYFRIFNPLTQAKKFDPDSKYIKKWVPELDTDAYPQPIIEHTAARLRAIRAYKEALSVRA